MTGTENDRRYPIGKFVPPGRTLSAEERGAMIDSIELAPARMRSAVARLDRAGLETPYREGGWKGRQVVHHVPDSHMNALIRFKLALTEDAPIIKPYDEALWAELADAQSDDVETSLLLLETVHRRWIRLLRAMSPGDFSRKLTHPEIGLIDLDHLLALYEWHGRHHVGQVESIAK